MIYILKPNTNEDTNLTLVQKYRDLIIKYGGKNTYIQHRGRRHLSYNISDYYDGIYVQMNFEGTGKLISLITKLMKFDEKIIRYFMVKQDQKHIFQT